MHAVTVALEHYATPIVLNYKDHQGAAVTFAQIHAAYKRDIAGGVKAETLSVADDYGLTVAFSAHSVIALVCCDLQQQRDMLDERRKLFPVGDNEATIHRMMTTPTKGTA